MQVPMALFSDGSTERSSTARHQTLGEGAGLLDRGALKLLTREAPAPSWINQRLGCHSRMMAQSLAVFSVGTHTSTPPSDQDGDPSPELAAPQPGPRGRDSRLGKRQPPSLRTMGHEGTGLVPSPCCCQDWLTRTRGQLLWIPAGSPPVESRRRHTHFTSQYLLQKEQPPPKNKETKTGRHENQFLTMEVKNIVINLKLNSPPQNWAQRGN